ncbi:MAG: hypothetical protein ACI9W1_000901 [Candidatus Azotimanducaceae bacterium]|jgi:hypothetical protein
MVQNSDKLCLVDVFVDTNIIFSKSACYLISKSVVDFVDEMKGIEGLRLNWSMADMVINERRYQMNRAAHEITKHAETFERLTGSQLNFNENTINIGIESIINQAIKEMGIQLLVPNYSEISLEEIAQKSAGRLLPFEHVEKNEKGFRDAIIGETFLQHYQASKENSSLFAFVTRDAALRKWIKDLKLDNVRPLEDLGQLESLINILLSEQSEETIKSVLPTAQKLFFQSDSESGLYRTADIRNKILTNYASELNDKLSTYSFTDRRTNGTWYISPPIFKKRDRNTITWISPLEIGFEIIEEQIQIPNTSSTEINVLSQLYKNDYPATANLTASEYLYRQIGQPNVLNYHDSSAPLYSPTYITKKVGRERFEVQWTAELENQSDLGNPQYIGVSYAGRVFE